MKIETTVELQVIKFLKLLEITKHNLCFTEYLQYSHRANRY